MKPAKVVSIRRARPEQLELIVPLFDAYRRFYKRSSDLAGAREFLRQRLERNESVIFLALDGEVPVGFVQLYPSFDSVAMRSVWILYDLFVAAAARRLGVGRQLMERARQHAIETGAKGLILETAKDNLSAQKLYEELGWKRDTMFHRYWLDV